LVVGWEIVKMLITIGYLKKLQKNNIINA